MGAEEILQRYGVPALRRMARQQGYTVEDDGKEPLVHLLAANLFSARRIEKAMAGMDSVESALLSLLILAGGNAITEEVKRRLLARGLITRNGVRQTGKRSREDAEPVLPDLAMVLSRLAARGLAFAADVPHESSSMELSTLGLRISIPQEILDHLPPVELQVPIADAPERVKEGDLDALFRDIYAFLSFAYRGPVTLIAKGTIAKRSLVQLEQLLMVKDGAAKASSEEELIRIPILRSILEELSLLMQRGFSLEAESDVEGFLDRPADERLRMLFDGFAGSRWWSELMWLSNLAVKKRGGREAAASTVVKGRKRVLSELALLPSMQWVSFGHLADRLRVKDYEFLFSRSVPPGGYRFGYLLNPYQGNNPMGWEFGYLTSESEGWEKVEAQFAAGVVAYGLHSLGLVDLGFSGELLTAFRLTEVGGRVLRGEPAMIPDAPPHVVVQPNFHLHAFPPTPEGVLFRFDRFAEQLHAERVVEYRLTRESVYRGQRAGLETSWMASFLEQVSGAPLPQNVARTLEEWGSQIDRVIVRRGVSALQVADEATLDALYADPALAPLLARRAAPTIAFVQASNLERLNRLLVSSDRIPSLTEGVEAPGLPLYSLDTGGRITFRHRVPSVHVLGALRPYVEDSGDGCPRLSPSSLRKAADSGEQAERIIEALGIWHAGPLAPEVAAIVRRAAKRWGKGSVEEVVLLRVEGSKILEDLMADPAIGPYLRPLKGGPGLAVVSRGAKEKVRKALQQMGMELEGPSSP